MKRIPKQPLVAAGGSWPGQERIPKQVLRICPRALRRWRFVGLCAVIVHSLLMIVGALCPRASGAEPHPTVRLEGTSQLTSLGADGSVIAHQEPKRFSVWVSGCQWAVRLYANTNQPNGITDVSCDGTNIYVLIPDAGGQTSAGRSQTAFAQSGSVSPGQIKVFPMRMGPIWWAYCSGCVIERDGPILDFMELTKGDPESRGMVDVKLGGSKPARNRIGAVESWLFPSQTARGQAPDTVALAHLRPLGLCETEGLILVTNCSVTKSYPAAVPNGAGQARYEYRLTVTQFGLEANPVSFVPEITKPALISDHRTPSSGEYVADHWLSAEERKTVRRTPLTAQVAPAKPVGFIRIVLLVLIVFPLAGIGLARLLGAKKGRNMTNLKER